MTESTTFGAGFQLTNNQDNDGCIQLITSYDAGSGTAYDESDIDKQDAIEMINHLAKAFNLTNGFYNEADL